MEHLELKTEESKGSVKTEEKPVLISPRPEPKVIRKPFFLQNPQTTAVKRRLSEWMETKSVADFLKESGFTVEYNGTYKPWRYQLRGTRASKEGPLTFFFEYQETKKKVHERHQLYLNGDPVNIDILRRNNITEFNEIPDLGWGAGRKETVRNFLDNNIPTSYLLYKRSNLGFRVTQRIYEVAKDLFPQERNFLRAQLLIADCIRDIAKDRGLHIDFVKTYYA